MSLYLPKTFAHRQLLSDKAKLEQAKAGLKRHATAEIQKHFPEHLFTVEVDMHGNILIDHLLLRHSKARYFLPYDKYDHGKGAVKLAGEILERVEIKRGELLHYEEYDVADRAAQTQFNAR